MTIKLLFQGDSITDCFRDRSDYHNLGGGYPKYASQLLKEKYLNIDFEFINLGISGNQTVDLVARLQTDFIDIQPDIVSIMIGINDVWHHSYEKNWIPNEVFEARYRTVLEGLKTQTKAKILMIEPYLVPIADKLHFREDLAPKIEIIRKLALEYADAYLPTDGLLHAAFVNENPLNFAYDGVHTTDKGAYCIAEHYVTYVSKLIDELLAK